MKVHSSELAKVLVQLAALVEPRLIDDYGDRCSEYEPHCPCCRAWSAYDDLVTVLMEGES